MSGDILNLLAGHVTDWPRAPRQTSRSPLPAPSTVIASLSEADAAALAAIYRRDRRVTVRRAVVQHPSAPQDVIVRHVKTHMATSRDPSLPGVVQRLTTKSLRDVLGSLPESLPFPTVMAFVDQVAAVGDVTVWQNALTKTALASRLFGHPALSAVPYGDDVRRQALGSRSLLQSWALIQMTLRHHRLDVPLAAVVLEHAATAGMSNHAVNLFALRGADLDALHLWMQSSCRPLVRAAANRCTAAQLVDQLAAFDAVTLLDVVDSYELCHEPALVDAFLDRVDELPADGDLFTTHPYLFRDALWHPLSTRRTATALMMAGPETAATYPGKLHGRNISVARFHRISLLTSPAVSAALAGGVLRRRQEPAPGDVDLLFRWPAAAQAVFDRQLLRRTARTTPLLTAVLDRFHERIGARLDRWEASATLASAFEGNLDMLATTVRVCLPDPV